MDTLLKLNTPESLTSLEDKIRNIREIRENISVIHYKSGETIYKRATPVANVFYVRSGLVKIVAQANDVKSSILHFFHKNEFIALSEIFGSKFYSHTAVATDDSIVESFSCEVLFQIIASNPSFARNILHLVRKQEILEYCKQLESIKKPVYDKLLEFLNYLAEEVYEDKVFKLVMDRSEIADYLGVSEKTIGRVFNDLKQKNVIKQIKKNIWINNNMSLPHN